MVRDSSALRRTDVFPGLGWMLTRDFWDEVIEICWREFTSVLAKLHRVFVQSACFLC